MLTAAQRDFDSTPRTLRIALGVPEWQPFQHAMENKPADATYVIQRYVAMGLKEKGHQVTYIAPDGLEDFVFTEDHQNVKPAKRTWSAGLLFTFFSKAVWKLQSFLDIPYLNVFSNYRYMDACLQRLPGHDLVYERNGLYNSGLAMACRKMNIPYLIFFEADQIMELDIMGKPIKGLLRWRAEQILRYNLETADGIICVSNAGKDHLIKKWDVPARKLVVFPNAVDVRKFKSNTDARTQVRKTLNVVDNPTMLFVGNFFHWHDVATLLDAFAYVLKSHPDARLVLVGDGERRPAMVKRVADLGIYHAVSFTGLVPHTEVPRYMSAADIAVVPYPPMQQEMWLSPLKLFEYMASGRAVVASEIGQIIEVIQNGENGLLVPPGDVSALTNALNELIHDTDLRSRLGARAKEDAERKYSWDHYISRLATMFEAVIARQPLDSI